MAGYSIGKLTFKTKEGYKLFRIYDPIDGFHLDILKLGENDERQKQKKEFNKSIEYIVKEDSLFVTDKSFSSFGTGKYGTIEDRIIRSKGTIDRIHLSDYDGLIITDVKISGMLPYCKGLEFEPKQGGKYPLTLSGSMDTTTIYEFITKLVMLKDKKRVDESWGFVVNPQNAIDTY